MTKAFDVVSDQATSNHALASDHSAAPCHSEWMRDGIRFKFIYSSLEHLLKQIQSLSIVKISQYLQIQVNLCDFTRRAYGTNYVETTRIQIHANCRLRRVNKF
jgi:hypothetical protein